MENHYSDSKQLMMPKDQRSFEGSINNEQIGKSSTLIFQENIDDVRLSSTRTNSMLLSAASNDILTECQNNYENNEHNRMTNDKRFVSYN